MDTLQQIEKRRRELRVASLFLIYFLSLVVFGLLFFVDQLNGFFAGLVYNIFLRTLFVGMIIVFIVNHTRKERAQAALTKQLLAEAGASADRLRKELRYNKFLDEIRGSVRNLNEDAGLEKLFDSSLKFFNADGGAVVLRTSGTSWKPPLISAPAEIDAAMIQELTKVIGRTGKSFLQPQPEYPEHRLIKTVNSVIAVPLRLENRLYGLIAFWSDDEDIYEQSDLNVVEQIVKETATAELNIERIQARADQLRGLLELVGKAGDEKARAEKQTVLLLEHAGAIAVKLNLPKDTTESLKIAARLRHVDLVANGSAGGAGSAEILAGLGFSQDVVDALSADAGHQGNGPKTIKGAVPISAQILAVSEMYIEKAYPQRGRKPSPVNVLTKLEPLVAKHYDGKVFAALKEVVLVPNISGGPIKTG